MKKLTCIICGMTVDENNYHINENAFLNKNIKEDIRYCPFCGAVNEFLVTDGEVFTVNRDALDEKTIKILDHASKLEIFNSDYYKEASKLSKDEKLKKVFGDLAKIELMHARVHLNLLGKIELPILKNINYDNLLHKDGELLANAEKREEHAVAFYQKYLPEIREEKIRKILKVLSAIEQEHIILANCLI
jgi:rubrerythrin